MVRMIGEVLLLFGSKSNDTTSNYYRKVRLLCLSEGQIPRKKSGGDGGCHGARARACDGARERARVVACVFFACVQMRTSRLSGCPACACARRRSLNCAPPHARVIGCPLRVVCCCCALSAGCCCSLSVVNNAPSFLRADVKWRCTSDVPGTLLSAEARLVVR